MLLNPNDEKPLRRDIKLRPKNLGEIKEKLTDIKELDEISWIFFDVLEFVYALGWDINNKHLAFEKLKEEL